MASDFYMEEEIAVIVTLDGEGGYFSDENKHSFALMGDFDLVLKY